jgi:hypothetical protein
VISWKWIIGKEKNIFLSSQAFQHLIYNFWGLWELSKNDNFMFAVNDYDDSWVECCFYGMNMGIWFVFVIFDSHENRVLMILNVIEMMNKWSLCDVLRCNRYDINKGIERYDFLWWMFDFRSLVWAPMESQTQNPQFCNRGDALRLAGVLGITRSVSCLSLLVDRHPLLT